MKVTVNHDGRIFIPASICDRLGLTPGSVLELEVDTSGTSGEVGDSITLRPKEEESPLRRMGDLLVHTDRLQDEHFDVVKLLRDQRDKRARSHAGFSK